MKGIMDDKTRIELSRICKRLVVLEFKLEQHIAKIELELKRLKKKK
jgi:hypothetical protein